MIDPKRHLAIRLRDTVHDDLPAFFEQQRDPEANWMAAFGAKDPADREAFEAHWRRILDDGTMPTQTVLVDEDVAGHVLAYKEQDRLEVSYWFDRKYWRKGIATKALAQFLRQQPKRPIYARVAKDNIGSRRVLEKCGFVVVATESGFANGRGAEVEELVMRLESG